jgi:hypothetical protein
MTTTHIKPRELHSDFLYCGNCRRKAEKNDNYTTVSFDIFPCNQLKASFMHYKHCYIASLLPISKSNNT